DMQGEAGGGVQERPAGPAEEDTLVHEPPRAEGEGVAEEETAQGAPGVEGAGDAASAARPDVEGEAGGGAQERPASQAEEDTLVHEPPRAEGEGVAEEETAQGAPGVEGA